MEILDNDILEELKAEHKEEFGIDPVIIGLYWNNEEKLIDALDRAIEEGTPYDELSKLSPSEREAYESGELVF